VVARGGAEPWRARRQGRRSEGSGERQEVWPDGEEESVGPTCYATFG
jgi:hypothetical protein